MGKALVGTILTSAFTKKHREGRDSIKDMQFINRRQDSNPVTLRLRG